MGKNKGVTLLSGGIGTACTTVVDGDATKRRYKERYSRYELFVWLLTGLLRRVGYAPARYASSRHSPSCTCNKPSHRPPAKQIVAFSSGRSVTFQDMEVGDKIGRVVMNAASLR
jgi:hypothetical protein